MQIKDSYRSVDIIIERAKMTNIPVIIATSTDASDDVFVDIAREHDVRIFRGSLLNKIKRWHDCFNQFGIENALLIDGDDLSYDFDIGIRAMNELKSSKSEMMLYPKDIVPGFFTYAIKKSAIIKLYRLVSDEKSNTDVITKYIEKANLDISYVTLLEHEKGKNVRLTLDYEEDLSFFRELYKNIDILANGKKIIDFLMSDNSVVQINLFRQNDFLKNQEKFNRGIQI